MAGQVGSCLVTKIGRPYEVREPGRFAGHPEAVFSLWMGREEVTPPPAAETKLNLFPHFFPGRGCRRSSTWPPDHDKVGHQSAL
jgi:hypothetical protein